jgi:hypothetical protein
MKHCNNPCPVWLHWRKTKRMREHRHTYAWPSRRSLQPSIIQNYTDNQTYLARKQNRKTASKNKCNTSDKSRNISATMSQWKCNIQIQPKIYEFAQRSESKQWTVKNSVKQVQNKCDTLSVWGGGAAAQLQILEPDNGTKHVQTILPNF